jgi:hypothetical protein
MLHVLTFSEAVQRDLLVEYKVILLAVDENHINARLNDGTNQLKVDDVAKIIGCWKALSKQNLTELSDDDAAMKRAVAFCQVTEVVKGAKTHKVNSKHIASMFRAVVEAYQRSAPADEPSASLKCEADIRTIFFAWVASLTHDHKWGPTDPLFPAPLMGHYPLHGFCVFRIKREHWTTTKEAPRRLGGQQRQLEKSGRCLTGGSPSCYYASDTDAYLSGRVSQ